MESPSAEELLRRIASLFAPNDQVAYEILWELQASPYQDGGVVVGGGAVVWALLQEDQMRPGDVDLFVRGEHVERVANRLFAALGVYDSDGGGYPYTDAPGLVSIRTNTLDVQVVSVAGPFKNAETVIWNFTLDYECCGLSADRLIITDACRRAHRTRVIADVVHGPVRMSRYVKAARKGFHGPCVNAIEDKEYTTPRVRYVEKDAFVFKPVGDTYAGGRVLTIWHYDMTRRYCRMRVCACAVVNSTMRYVGVKYDQIGRGGAAAAVVDDYYDKDCYFATFEEPDVLDVELLETAYGVYIPATAMAAAVAPKSARVPTYVWLDPASDGGARVAATNGKSHKASMVVHVMPNLTVEKAGLSAGLESAGTLPFLASADAVKDYRMTEAGTLVHAPPGSVHAVVEQLKEVDLEDWTVIGDA